MKKVKDILVKKTITLKVYCNCCGEPIGDEDHLEVEKRWGFGSSKDGQTHTFDICSACYDRWIETFAIPPEQL